MAARAHRYGSEPTRRILVATLAATLALPLLAGGCATPGESWYPATGREHLLVALARPERKREDLVGLLSTGLSSLRHMGRAVTPQLESGWRGEYHYERLLFELSDGTRVGGNLVRLDPAGSEPKPLLIVSFGFLQDRWGTEAAKFQELYVQDPERRIQADILYLDHPSAGPFLARNGNLSMGAYDDGRMWIEIARQMKPWMQAASIHLLGVSMSGQSVVHALIEDARLGLDLFDSGLAVSIAPDFQRSPGDQLAHLPTAEDVVNPWDEGAGSRTTFSDELQSRAVWMLIQQQFLPSYRLVSPDGDLELEKKNLAVFLRDAFEDRIRVLRERRTSTWNDDFSLADVESFMTTSRIADVIERVQTPLVLLNARDDPAVPSAQFQQVAEAARGNPWVLPYESRRGGHFGFDVVYGPGYVGRLIRLMLDPEVIRTWAGSGTREGRELAVGDRNS